MVSIGAAYAAGVVVWQVVHTAFLGHGQPDARHGTLLLWTAVSLIVLAAAWLVRLALRLHRGRTGARRQTVISGVLLLVVLAIPPYSWLGAIPLIVLAAPAVFALVTWALYERAQDLPARPDGDVSGA
jgi:hypothetical protein